MALNDYEEGVFEALVHLVMDAHARDLDRALIAVEDEFSRTAFSCDQNHGQEMVNVSRYFRDEVVPKLRELSPMFGACERLEKVKDMN